MKKTYRFDIVEEKENGDCILQFSDEFLKDHDWRTDDTLHMEVVGESLVIKNLDWEKREGISK